MTGATSRPEHLSAKQDPAEPPFPLSPEWQHYGAVNLGSGIRSHGADLPDDPC